MPALGITPEPGDGCLASVQCPAKGAPPQPGPIVNAALQKTENGTCINARQFDGTPTYAFTYSTEATVCKECITIPLKSGGVLSVGWARLGGQDALQSAYDDKWMPAGASGVFSLLPRVNQLSAPAGGLRVYSNPSSLSYDSGSVPQAQLPVQASRGTTYFTTYDQLSGTYYEYFAGTGLSTSAPGYGRLNRRYDIRGNVIQYNYGPNPAGNSLLRSLSGDITGNIVPYFYYDNETVDATHYAPVMKIALLDQVNPQSTRTVYFQYSGYKDAVTSAYYLYLTQIVNPLGCTDLYDPVVPFNDTSDAYQLKRDVDSEGYQTYFNYTAGSLNQVIEPEGRVTYYEYPSQGVTRQAQEGRPKRFMNYSLNSTGDRLTQVTQYTDPEFNSSYFTYDQALSRMTKKIDPNQNITYYEYIGGSAANQYAAKKQVRALDNAQTYFGYSGTYDLVKKVGPRFALGAPNEVTYYTYDAARNKTSMIDALGNTTLYGSDSAGRMVKTRDARGNGAYFNYSASTGGLDSQIDALGSTTYFGYNSFVNRTAEVGPRWKEQGSFATFTTYYAYDALNRRTKSIDPQGNVTYFDYTSRGLLLDTVDALGTVSASTYNGLKLRTQTSVTDKAGTLLSQTKDGYDTYKNRIQSQDGLGNATYFFYDTIDRQTAQKDALGNLSYFYYDPVGNRTVQTNARNASTYYFYDLVSRQTAMRDALANPTYYFYDVGDKQTHAVDARGNAAYFFYDALDRRQATRDALANPTYYFYDPVGNQSVTMDARFKATYFGYDQLNRQARIQDALANSTYYEYDAAGNQARVIDARANATTFAYDTLNRQSAMRDALANGTYYFYDAVGNRTKVTDARLNTTYYFYDGLRRTSVMRDAQANSAYYFYDLAGNQTRTVNARSAQTYFGYDQLNRRSKVQDALSNVTYYFYDSVGNQSAVQDARRNTSYYGYDLLNRPLATLDALQNSTYFFYDAVGNRTKVWDARRNTTYFFYDALNRPSVVQDALANPTYYSYDPVGNRTLLQNARFASTYFGYDAIGRQTQMQDALGNATYYVYDAVGNRTQITDARQGTMKMSYDALNRQTVLADPVGNATLFGYDQVGNLTAVDRGILGYGIQPYGTSSYGGVDGASTYFFYDTLSRRSATKDAVGGFAYYFYDQVGNRTGVRNPLLHTSYFGYDSLNRLVRTQDALGAKTYFEYDAVGNLTQTIDPDGHGSMTRYDALNRPDATRAPDTGSTYYFYDPIGNRTKDLDPLGKATYYGYDTLNRAARIQDALGKSLYFEYDQVGNRTKLIDSENAQTAYTYDTVNRPTDITYTPAGVTVSDGLKNAYYIYDQVGNVTQMGDLWGLHRVGFNLAQRPTQHQYPNTNVVYFRYDARWNVTARVYPGSAGTQGAAYDNLDRQTKIQSPSGAVAYFTYDAASNLNQRLLGNGAKLDATYDLAERTQTWRYSKSSNAPLTYFDYGRDSKGLITKAAREAPYTTYYTYDANDRVLSEVWANASNVEVYGYRYGYDLAGNRTKARVNGSDTYYVYDQANQITKKGTTALIANATYYTYDLNGALSDLIEPTGTTKFAYNAAGLVARMRWKDASATYFYYDGNLQRYALKQNGTTNYFLWDGYDPLQLLNADGTVKEEYTQAKSPIQGIGQLVEVNRPGVSPQKIYPVMDPRGTITKYIQSDGTTVVASREYDAFGNLIPNAASGTWPGMFGYQGQTWQEILSADGAQRLMMSPTRLYDPVDGRFLSRDPLRLADPTSSPRLIQPAYLYTAQNPIMLIDRDGMAITSIYAAQNEDGWQALSQFTGLGVNITTDGGRWGTPNVNTVITNPASNVFVYQPVFGQTAGRGMMGNRTDSIVNWAINSVLGGLTGLGVLPSAMCQAQNYYCAAFIAVGYYHVAGIPWPLNFGHMSLELWNECPPKGNPMAKEKDRFDPKNPPAGYTKEGAMELLNQIPPLGDTDWGHWSSDTVRGLERKWKWFGDWVSWIQSSSQSQESTVLYKNNNALLFDDVWLKWVMMKALSSVYPYAEQDRIHINHWPQSSYDWGGNNSNTFVREMAKILPRDPLDYVKDFPVTFPGNFPAKQVPDLGYNPQKSGSPMPNEDPKKYRGPWPNR